MGPTKAPPIDATSSRRSQPVRQTRTNPPRTSSNVKNSGQDAGAPGAALDQPIDIFPAVTHFADAITALPKELVRHFTLLKEVDAKIYAPERALHQLIEAALNSPQPDSRHHNDAASSTAPLSAPMSTQNSSAGAALNHGRPPAPLSADGSLNTAVFDPSNLPRRQLFRQTAFKIQEMLVSLEEKNHVISTANEDLQRHLSRIDHVWPQLQDEFHDDVKYGSMAHWAYPENRLAKTNQTERSRREGAATLSAAAQALADEAAARSDARKQAVLAKKNLKNNHHQESDFDDPDTKHKAEGGKKTQGNKSRKPAAETNTNVGLGITNATPSTNGNPPQKKRKVEKPANGAPMERAMSTVFGKDAAKTKTTSPRETPVPDGSKKRKALPTGTGQSKKSRTTAGAAVSPPVASSPVTGSFPDTANVGRGSPVPPLNALRPVSCRARQNSTQSSLDNGKPRPSSSASNKPNGLGIIPPDTMAQTNGTKVAAEPKVIKEPPAPPRPEAANAEKEHPVATAPSSTTKRESSAKATETETKKEPGSGTTTTVMTVTTKSGRASKPSTPAIGTFAEAGVRPRPSRNSETAKRSHKKGASQSLPRQAAVAQRTGEEANNSGQGDDEETEPDPNEPRYCYCQQVSYGEMVACDADDCPTEWFHLNCVGLKVAPKENVKWYCKSCQEQLKNKKPSAR